MPLQVTPWTPLLITAAILSFGLGFYVFRSYGDRNQTLVVPFSGIAFAGGWWAMTYALQLSSTTLSGKLFWNRFVWIGAAGMMILWPVFVLVYTAREWWTRPRWVALLSAIPASVVAIAWGGGLQSMLYLDPAVETVNGFQLMTFETGPVLLLIVSYSYVVNLVTYGLLWVIFSRRTGPVRWQAGLLLIAGVIPMVASFVGNLGVIGSRYVDLTPVAFLLTTPIIAWALFGHRLLDISPIPRDTLFADLSVGVLVISDEEYVVDANDVARSLFDGDLVGASIADAFEGYPSLVSALESSVDPVDTQLTVDTEDGITSLDVSTVSVDPSPRRGIDTVILLRDVTERELLERRYRTLVEKAPNVIATVDSDWRINYVSPSIERLLGYDQNLVIGDSILEYVHPDDQPEMDDLLERSEESREPVRIEHRVRHADGGWCQFQTTIEPLFEGGDEFVVTATDVTDQRTYEQRLQVLNRVLRHDLKNQINVIEGYVDLLQDHVDPEGQTHLDMVAREARDLAELSDLAREVEVALHTDPEIVAVDLTEAVSETVEKLRTTYDAVTVEVVLPDHAMATADSMYRSALDNVLQNAVEHNDRATPTVEVTVECGSEYVDVRVADNGPGIPRDQMAVIESGQETPLEHASGLGLWLVDWIVSRSGGELAFEDNDPRGSVVRLRFPRAAERAPESMDGAEQSADPE